MPVRKRNLNRRVYTLSANAQAWLRGDRQKCNVFFMGKHADELAELWEAYGYSDSMHWERGMRIPEPLSRAQTDS